MAAEDTEKRTEIPDKLYFRIGEVAELVGVEAHVLRYWETEFRLRPTRSSSGQRLYRKSDLARFLRVRQLLHEEGYTIAGARKVLLEGPEALAPTGIGVEKDALKDALRRIRLLRTELAGLIREASEAEGR
jgi:DNA-binding transcriptional MerR regulator